MVIELKNFDLRLQPIVVPPSRCGSGVGGRGDHRAVGEGARRGKCDRFRRSWATRSRTVARVPKWSFRLNMKF